MPACRWKARLGRAKTPPAQHPPHRSAQLPREIVRLIESAPERAPRMQRYGYDGVRIRQQRRAGPAHRLRKWASKNPPPPVFERVEDLAKRAFIAARAARYRESRCGAAAARALLRHAAPRGQGVAASHAHRRGDVTHGQPAGGADRTAQRALEQDAAPRAHRGQQCANNQVGTGRQHWSVGGGVQDA